MTLNLLSLVVHNMIGNYPCTSAFCVFGQRRFARDTSLIVVCVMCVRSEAFCS